MIKTRNRRKKCYLWHSNRLWFIFLRGNSIGYSNYKEKVCQTVRYKISIKAVKCLYLSKSAESSVVWSALDSFSSELFCTEIYSINITFSFQKKKLSGFYYFTISKIDSLLGTLVISSSNTQGCRKVTL